MKTEIKGVIAGVLFTHSILAQAALIKVDMVASGNWYQGDMNEPTLLDQAPNFIGSMIVDNSHVDEWSVVEGEYGFSLDGTTLAVNHYPFVSGDPDEYHPFSFDATGRLIGFSWLYFANTIENYTTLVGINSGHESWGYSEILFSGRDYYCFDDCLTITQSFIDVPVPEPSTFAILGIGSIGLALLRKRKNPISF